LPENDEYGCLKSGSNVIASLGRFDVVDIVQVADPKEVEKTVMIIRAYAHSTTETLGGTPWKEFLDML
jgi:uncharacterized protein with GYD domain